MGSLLPHTEKEKEGGQVTSEYEERQRKERVGGPLATTQNQSNGKHATLKVMTRQSAGEGRSQIQANLKDRLCNRMHRGKERASLECWRGGEKGGGEGTAAFCG